MYRGMKDDERSVILVHQNFSTTILFYYNNTTGETVEEKKMGKIKKLFYRV